MTDFEDAVTSEAAHAAQIDLIVTRNISDFEKSPTPAVLPGKLIEILSNEV
jgi:hypothetical protein